MMKIKIGFSNSYWRIKTADHPIENLATHAITCPNYWRSAMKISKPCRTSFLGSLASLGLDATFVQLMYITSSVRI